MAYTRAYECNGRCLDAKPSVTAIAERRIMEVEPGLYERAVANAYVTPGEQQLLNNLADESHDAAHVIAERVMWKGW